MLLDVCCLNDSLKIRIVILLLYLFCNILKFDLRVDSSVLIYLESSKSCLFGRCIVYCMFSNRYFIFKMFNNVMFVHRRTVIRV